MRLLVAISPHGYGHWGQTSALLTRLYGRYPDVTLILRTTLPESVLRQRLSAPFTVEPCADDFGMVMHDTLSVDVAESLQRYRDFHRDWEEQVATLAVEMKRAAIDLVLADVPYLPLAAAARASIPSVALCCLNWFDIAGAFVSDDAGDGKWLGQIADAYQSADCFLRTAPSMPMSWLDNGVDIGPVMHRGTNQAEVIRRQLGLKSTTKLVTVAMGGIPYMPALSDWPALDGVHWLVPTQWSMRRSDVTALETLALAFSDLVASSDLVLTKPGYSTFAEAAVSGVPVLYVEREAWPESIYLERWLADHANCRKITPQQFENGDFNSEAEALLKQGPYPAIAPSGIDEALAVLAKWLD